MTGILHVVVTPGTCYPSGERHAGAGALQQELDTNVWV